MSVDDHRAGPPHPWLRLGLLTGSVLVAFLGISISRNLGLALSVAALLVWIGTVAWAVRHGRRRARACRAVGEKPDLAYLPRRLLVYVRLLAICTVGTAVGLVLVLRSPSHEASLWPLDLVVVLLALMTAVLLVLARVVLPTWQEKQR